MAKITDIKAQVKHPDRVSVYVDGSFSFGLGMWQAQDLKLKIGQELNASELADLKQQGDFGKLYEKALRWLSLRKRSRWEIDQYLYRKTKDENLKTEVFTALEKAGHVDDEAFARSWLSNRRQTKLSSKRKLNLELRSKRVDPDTIQSVLSEDEADEADVLLQMIEKKRRLTRYQDDEKLMQYLHRQGFGYHDIKSALDQLES